MKTWNANTAGNVLHYIYPARYDTTTPNPLVSEDDGKQSAERKKNNKQQSSAVQCSVVCALTSCPAPPTTAGFRCSLCRCPPRCPPRTAAAAAAAAERRDGQRAAMEIAADESPASPCPYAAQTVGGGTARCLARSGVLARLYAHCKSTQMSCSCRLSDWCGCRTVAVVRVEGQGQRAQAVVRVARHSADTGPALGRRSHGGHRRGHRRRSAQV